MDSIYVLLVLPHALHIHSSREQIAIQEKEQRAFEKRLLMHAATALVEGKEPTWHEFLKQVTDFS
jgi:hypothetical protein